MVAPQRWRIEPPASDQGAEIGRLLREEAERPAPPLDAHAWMRLESTLRRKRRRGRWGLLGVGLPVLAAAAGIVVDRVYVEGTETEASEVVATTVDPSPVQPLETPGAPPPMAEPAPEASLAAAPPATAPVRRTRGAARSRPTATPPPTAPEAVDLDAVEREAAAAHRAGDGEAAARGYLQLARTSGLRAENALFKLGLVRLHLDKDTPGALRAWEEYRRRFPDGQLATEVDISVLEALEASGRHASVVREGEAFLRARPRSERAGEVHALLGSLLHEKGDCARALPHLEAGGRAALAPARVEEMAFRKTMCLAALGRRGEAREALRAYLSRFPSGRYRAAVERALTE